MNIEELIRVVDAKKVDAGDTLYAITYDSSSGATSVYAGPLVRSMTGERQDSVIIGSAEDTETKDSVLVVTYQDEKVTSKPIGNVMLYGPHKLQESSIFPPRYFTYMPELQDDLDNSSLIPKGDIDAMLHILLR